ncbi:MAG: hypothetical protein ACP5D2_03025 [Candidatus Nanoarchaeia archaeon]
MVWEVYIIRVKEEEDASQQERVKKRTSILEGKVRDRMDREYKPFIPLPNLILNGLVGFYNLTNNLEQNLATLNQLRYAC